MDVFLLLVLMAVAPVVPVILEVLLLLLLLVFVAEASCLLGPLLSIDVKDDDNGLAAEVKTLLSTGNNL